MMRKLLSILFLTVSLLMPCAAAEDQLRAVVINLAGNASEMIVAGRDGENVRLRPTTGQATGELVVSPHQIRGLRFMFPAEIEPLIGQDLTEEQLAAVSPWAQAVLPYLNLPETNALPLVLTYANALRQLQRVQEGITFFTKMGDASTGVMAEMAALLQASLMASAGRVDEAAGLVQKVQEPDRASDLFALLRLVQGQVQLAKGNSAEALRLTSQALAFSSLDSQIYPEALFYTGRSYEESALAGFEQAKLQRETAIERAVRAERMRLAQDLMRDSKPVPPEEELLAMVDRNAIESAVLPPESLEQQSDFRISQQIYRQITRLFADTRWAKDSQSRIRSNPENSQ